MDKKRRDVKTNHEWWWKDLYDENGERGEQLQWDGSAFLPLYVKNWLKGWTNIDW
jgi:hypothetical protein